MRIAVYLHDNIGQKLAISSIKLGQLKDAALAANSEALVAGLNEIRLLFKQIIQDTKSLTFKISSPILYELGLRGRRGMAYGRTPKSAWHPHLF